MGFLRNWLRGDRTAPSEPPRGIANEEVLADPGRAKHLRLAASFLPDVDCDVITDVVRTFLAAVMDVPASENHHHKEPWGLFDHSLEVAEHALRASLSEPFVDSTDAKPEEQEYRQPRLRFGAWCWGLFHDAGKVAHIAIRGPGRETWNPYREPLLAFYERHGGRQACRLTWRRGRTLDGHTWATAYLLGRLVPESAADYLGPGLLSELIEQQTPPARRVFRLIEEADHRSTRESLARQARADEASGARSAGPVLFTPDAEYADRLPPLLAGALRDGTLRQSDDLASSDAFVGRAYLALRYPEALQKIAVLVHETLGRECALARALDGSEEGARTLAAYLHDHHRLFADAATRTWKLKAKMALGDTFDVLHVVLVPRAFVDPALREGPRVFGGEAAFARASDGASVFVDDFRKPAAQAAPVLRPPDVPAPTAPSASMPAPAQPDPPAPRPPMNPPVPTPRKLITGETLLDDLRGAILGGRIATNVWNGQVYVLPDVTYLVSPRIFTCLVKLGLYARDPGIELNAYLDALARVPCVRKDAAGKVQLAVEVRPGARPVWVVALETRGFFPDARSLAAVGHWTASAIRELSDAELRAVQLALRAKRSIPAPAVPPESAKGGAPHAP